MGVAWKRPPYKPTPLSKKDTSKLLATIRQEHSSIITVSLEYSMDFSRLELTALDSKRNSTEYISIGFVGFKPTLSLFSSCYTELGDSSASLPCAT